MTLATGQSTAGPMGEKFMRRLLIAVALVAGVPSAASATDVATFLVKAESMKGNKLKAIFSGDAKRLMGEVSSSMQQLKAERLQAEASGKRGSYCPNGPASFSQNELFAALQAVPPAERPRVRVKEALRRGLMKKYPCG